MPLSITLATAAPHEAHTRDQLRALLERYDLRRWQWTDTVVIQDGVVPHSHPVLTLNTRFPDDSLLVLATYVHEQLHWFMGTRWEQAQAAIAEVKARYPRVAVGYPRGARDAASSYLHYLICALEYATLIELVGPDGAHRAITVWCADHYTDIYAAVLRESAWLDELLARHGLRDCTVPDRSREPRG